MAYTVQSGDSLYKIARDNGITYQELIRLNPQYADNPNLIRPGQTVNLPQTGEIAEDNDSAFFREPGFRDDIPNNTDYPAHWGEPPMAQTKDLAFLPGGYGRGSSTLATWIADNMRKDNPDITTIPTHLQSAYTVEDRDDDEIIAAMYAKAYSGRPLTQSDWSSIKD